MRRELRDGIAEAAPYLLAHHTASQLNRCHRVTLLGREVHLCARCSGIYPGILLGLVSPLGATPLWLLALLPAPALVDWTITSFRAAHDSNIVRTATGLALGYGYGVGLTQLFGDGRVAVLGVGVAYGLLAVVLLSVQRTGAV